MQQVRLDHPSAKVVHPQSGEIVHGLVWELGALLSEAYLCYVSSNANSTTAALVVMIWLDMGLCGVYRYPNCNGASAAVSSLHIRSATGVWVRSPACPACPVMLRAGPTHPDSRPLELLDYCRIYLARRMSGSP